MATRFQQSERIGLLAGGNNINSPGFSFGNQKMNFGGGNNRSFGGGQGIVTSNNYGVNYINAFGNIFELSSDYFYKNSDSDNKTTSDRETFLSDGTSFIRKSKNTSFNESDSHDASVDFEIEIDSVKKFELSGTTILPSTINQQIAKGYGLYLKSVKITECDNESEPTGIEEVNEIIETDSTLIIKTKINGNCCHDFLCDINIINDNTINLIHHGYGESYCSCNCCFGLTYEFSTMRIDNYEKIKLVMINGKKNTLKEK